MTEHIGDFDERRVVADETRRLLRAIRLTEVSEDDLAKASELIAEATAILEREAPIKPLWLTGYTSIEQYRTSTDPNDIFPFSPATGPLNPVAPVTELTIDDDGVLTGQVTFSEYHNGPPFDLGHGGAVALVYDELLGVAAMANGGGYTANLTVDYRVATPLLVPVQFRVWAGQVEGRKLWAQGEMRYEGQVLTEAKGLFITPRSETDPAPRLT
ncbi:hypothetical protein BH10ACT3_BH10ACT3_24510 [soil metagenome]